MDLSTTKTIKRRILEISPSQTNALTNCNITVSNWFQSIDTTFNKFRISSFYMNNSTIPAFIGGYLPQLYSLNIPSNTYLIQDPVTEVVSAGTPILTNQILNYYVSIKKVSTGASVTSYIYMKDGVSEYPALKQSIHSGSSFGQYDNRYFWFYNTSKFCDLVSDILNDILITGFSEAAANYAEIVRTSQGYGLYFDNAMVIAGYKISFSQSLMDLFQFKSIGDEQLREIIFNTNLRSYGNPVKPYNYVASNYVPDTWAPFSQLLIKSDLPIENEIFYESNNYISQNYQNIMLTFTLSNNNPDSIYNFFKYTPNADDGWVSMVGTNTRENCTFETLLKLRETGDLIPYTIKKNEIFRLVTETIVTDSLVQ